MRQLELALDPERRRTDRISLNQATMEKLVTRMAMMMIAILRATKGGDADGTGTRDNEDQ